MVGDYTNAGREWHPQGEPVPVRVHDFIDDTLGKVIPYGVYDLAQNTGWVNVGVDHDTPTFAVESIARWWRFMGKRSYPTATELFITAGAGGSNSARSRSWKVELQRFADRTGLAISVSHFPPGTSKWNKIRASALLSHHRELARPAARRPGDRRATDRERPHDDRAHRQSQA